MARLWSSGFELNSVTTGVEGPTFTGGTISTTTVRSGIYSYRNNPSASIHNFTYTFSGGIQTVYIRFYYYVTTHPASGSLIHTISAGATTCCRIRGTGSGIRVMDTSDTQVGSDAAVSTGQWYRVEVRLTANGTSSTYELRLDGVSQVSSSSFASGASGAALTVTQFGSGGALTHDYYLEDLAINSSGGSFQNSWPGEGKIVHLRPNAAGDNTGLTTGVSDNTNHYLNVDEVTPDDDTTYNQTSTASQIDDYNLDASGIGASDTVNVVQVGVRYRKVTSGTLVFNVRAKASSGGTVEASSNISSIATTFQTNAEAAPRNHPLTMYDLPGGSTTAWTQADLDTAQIGVETVSNTANNWRFTSIWMLVDYTPAAAGDLSVAVSDNATVSESVKVELEGRPSVSDSITVTDSLSSYSDLILTRESYTVSIVAGAADLSVAVSDNITLSESVARMVENYVTKSDSVTITENRALDVPVNVSTSDSVTVTEALQRLVTNFILRSDSVTLTESVVAFIPEMRPSVSDTVTITEALNVVREEAGSRSISVQDSITVTENVSLTIPTLYIQVSDSATVTEQVSVSIAVVASGTDHLLLLGVG